MGGRDAPVSSPPLRAQVTRDKLRSIYDDDTKSYALRLEFAAMLDMRILVKTTYDLEGDRLEIMLTYDRIEGLRAIGTAIGNKDDGVLPNVDAVVRRMMPLKKNVKVEKYFDGHGVCTGKLDKKEKVDSTYAVPGPGARRVDRQVRGRHDRAL